MVYFTWTSRHREGRVSASWYAKYVPKTSPIKLSRAGFHSCFCCLRKEKLCFSAITEELSRKMVSGALNFGDPQPGRLVRISVVPLFSLREKCGVWEHGEMRIFVIHLRKYD